MSGLLFEWSRSKSGLNLRKHGVGFHEAMTVFADPLSQTILDPGHFFDEQRYVTMGRTRSQRLLVVIHTDREGRIRIISARTATRHEQRQYENHPEEA